MAELNCTFSRGVQHKCRRSFITYTTSHENAAGNALLLTCVVKTIKILPALGYLGRYKHTIYHHVVHELGLRRENKRPKYIVTTQTIAPIGIHVATTTLKVQT